MEALLTSASRLIAERGTAVSLRDIAQDADVNLGLVHRYLGNKDQLVEVVYSAAANIAAERLAGASNLGEALERLMTLGDGTTARLIGWAILEGKGDAIAFRDSPALTVMTDLLRRDLLETDVRLEDEDLRVFSAFAMTVALGWRLFAPTALSAAGLDGSDSAEHTDRVIGYLRGLHEAIVRGEIGRVGGSLDG